MGLTSLKLTHRGIKRVLHSCYMRRWQISTPLATEMRGLVERGPNSEGGVEEILFGDVGRRRVLA